MDAPTKSGLAPVNGIQLAYQVFGDGDPLVLLHGSFGSVEMFGPNVAALAAGRMVIGVDLQSHGRTPATDRPMRHETMGDDIAALIRHLGFGRADVMGFSLGGGVALRTAIQHPDVVRRLIVVSTPYKRSGWYREMTAAMDRMGPEIAEPFKQTPHYQVYRRIAPRRGRGRHAAKPRGGVLRAVGWWAGGCGVGRIGDDEARPRHSAARDPLQHQRAPGARHDGRRISRGRA